MIHLTEDILQFAWRNSLFDQRDLKTVNGEEILILNKGATNLNSGPDFNNAKIKIGETLWAGNVEIHIHSSDWNNHKHQLDKAYDNVILHVVYFHDTEIFVNDQELPVLELKNRIPPSLFRKYKNLISREYDLSCNNLIKGVKSISILNQLERSLIERLTRKSEQILSQLAQNKNDWEETSFQLLAKNMVGKINEQPVEWLLNRVSLKTLRNSGDSLFAKEALLFGVSGWLNSHEDDYTLKLYSEFHYLKKKFDLEELNPVIWKFGRMRPPQFPSFRLAQLASLVHHQDFLFSSMLEFANEKRRNDFFNIEASGYWKVNCHLNKSIKPRASEMGSMQKQLLIINVVAPLIFAYGKFMDDTNYCEKAINLLMDIPSEKNHILKKWAEVDIKPTSSFESQGLIELYNHSCIPKKCLTCIIGMQILST